MIDNLRITHYALLITKAYRRALIGLVTYLVIGLSFNAFAEESQFDKYGGWKGLKGEKTGWFHTEKINGRWWIVTPEGNVFWSIQIYCVRFGGLPETGTGRRAYKEACIRKYGNEKEWARISRFRIRKWGFNTVGDWSSESIYTQPGLAYVIGIDLPRGAFDVIPEGYWGYFPDVFSQGFRDSVKEAMEKRFTRQPYLINDSWLLGYFLADDTPWFGSKQRHEGLVDDYIGLTSEHEGKKAWVGFIKSRYTDVKQLNETWQTDFKNFNELMSVREIKNNEVIKKDKLAFLKVIAEEFSKVLAEIYTMSFYGLNKGYRIDPQFLSIVEKINIHSQRPIILGISVPAQGTKLPYGIVKTQKDRGISYWKYLAELASHPAIVGAHWFQYFDPPLKCYDNKPENWGLVNDEDEPYEEAVSLISEANKMVYAYALGVSGFVPEFDGFFGLAKKETPEMPKSPLKKIAIPIPNTGFEQGKRDWKLQSWKGESKTSIDSSEKHSGKSSLKIQGGPDEGWESVGVGVQANPSFILIPGYQYKLSVWVKSQDVDDFCFVRIKVKDENGGDGYFTTPKIYGTQGWKQYEIEFSPNTENSAEYLVAQLVGTGTVWFDDIALEVLAPEGTPVKEFTKTGESQSQKVTKSQVIKKLPLSNSGFEEGKKDWALQAWKGRPRVGIDKWVAHSGKRSVKIRGSGSNWNSVGIANKQNLNIVLEPGKQYRLSGWIKDKDVEDSAFIRIKVKYDDGSGDYFQTNSLDGTGDWEKVTKEFRPARANSIEYLACQLVGAGEAWFDDISIEELAR